MEFITTKYQETFEYHYISPILLPLLTISEVLFELGILFVLNKSTSFRITNLVVTLLFSFNTFVGFVIGFSSDENRINIWKKEGDHVPFQLSVQREPE